MKLKIDTSDMISDTDDQTSVALFLSVSWFCRTSTTASLLLLLLPLFLVEDLPVRLRHPAQFDVLTQAAFLQSLVELSNTNIFFFSS